VDKHATSVAPPAGPAKRGTHPGPPAPRQAGGGRPLGRAVVGSILTLIIASGGYYYWEHGHSGTAVHAGGGSGEKGSGRNRRPAGLPVEVAHPRAKGIERTTTQAGSVHAFEHASLYAKVSGYLKVQNVDIGDRVKLGQLLVVIEDPEVDKAVEQNVAALDQSKARVKVAEAKIRSASADKDAADALIKQSETEVAAKVSNHVLQEKQLARIRGLVERNAVEAKLQDEQQDRLDVSMSDLGMARAAVLTSRAQAMAKAALIESAQADLVEARANVGIAEANLGKAKVMQEYTRITSPYDGVVTVRSFHRGDFVRAATEGGGVPVMAVARTDMVRVVLPVPDVDVPFVDKGDPAILQIVALPGMTFRGVVSRFSETEDPESRNMRTEVDLPNPDGKLREGMYGRMTLMLQAAAPNSLTIPSSGLLDQTGKGDGSVYVVRDGKARKIPVRVGNDNGVESEILSGLKPKDEVIVRYNGSLGEGVPVAAEPSRVAQAGH